MRWRVSGGKFAPLAVLAIFAAGAAAGDEVAGAEPATLIIWNRPVAEFRATVAGVAPAQRARNAERRILALPAGFGSARITRQPARLGSSRGVVVSLGGPAGFWLLAGGPRAGGEK